MPIIYNISRSYKISGDDFRRVHEIMDAVGLQEAEAIRYAIEVTTILLQFAVKEDPKAVFVEHQHGRGRVTFLEKMSEAELAETMLYVRECIGQARFDKLLTDGQKKREGRRNDTEFFIKAMKALIASMDPPYSFDQIALAITKVAKCNLQWTKVILDREWQAGKLSQASPGKYEFVIEPQKKEHQST